MRDRERTCFTCGYMRMCYCFRAMTFGQLVRFDTNSIDYSKNHDKFFKTLAEVCEVYEYKEEK